MEVNYMMAYGSAEASLRLLWKLGLLEILLPVQVDNAVIQQGFEPYHVELLRFLSFILRISSRRALYCRQRILSALVFADVASSIICFW